MRQSDPPINPTRKYSVLTSARTLGVDKKTVYNWIKKGYIKAQKNSKDRIYIKGLTLLQVYNDLVI